MRSKKIRSLCRWMSYEYYAGVTTCNTVRILYCILYSTVHVFSIHYTVHARLLLLGIHTHTHSRSFTQLCYVP